MPGSMPSTWHGADKRSEVLATDRTGGTIEIRARQVVIAAGPWTDELISGTDQAAPVARAGPSALNVLIGRRL